MKQLFPEKKGYFEQYVVRMVLYQIGFFLVIAVIMAIHWPHMVGGWLAGGAFNLAYFVVLAAEVRATPNRTNDEVAQRVAAIATSRIFFSLIFIIAVLKTGWVHFGAAVCGLLSLKIVYYLETFGRVIKNRLRKSGLQ